MPGTKREIGEIERKTNLIKLMIEKRRERMAYYEKLINMGLSFSDTRRLEFLATVKRLEITDMLKELDWLDMQRSFYEL